MKSYSHVVYIMMGLPASGKTTQRNGLRKALTLRSGAPVTVSSDDFLDLMADGQDITYNEAFKKYMSVADESFWAALRLAVAINSPTIIVDRTNMTVKSRRRIIDAVQSIPGGERYKFVIAECRATDEDIEARNEQRAILGKKIPENVIDGMKKSYQQPNAEEHPDIVCWSYYDTSANKYHYIDFVSGEVIERSLKDIERN